MAKGTSSTCPSPFSDSLTLEFHIYFLHGFGLVSLTAHPVFIALGVSDNVSILPQLGSGLDP